METGSGYSPNSLGSIDDFLAEDPTRTIEDYFIVLGILRQQQAEALGIDLESLHRAHFGPNGEVIV